MARLRLNKPPKSKVPFAPSLDMPIPRHGSVQINFDTKRSGGRKGPPPWALMVMRKRALRRMASFTAALLCLALIVAVSGVRVTRGTAGTVGVVRNGGPFDARTIRQIIEPGQALTYIGMFSQSPHRYPASQVTLKYTATSTQTTKPQPAVDTIVLPTVDGVQVGIDAAVFFRFIGDADVASLQRFDKSVGTRHFATPDGRWLYPWQSDEGFSAMLDSLFRPVLENDLRKEIGRFQCALLVSSCSLIRKVSVTQPPAPSENIASIETRINDSLQSDLTQALGHLYFFDVRFRIGRVTLPVNVQKAVDEVQAQYAAVNTARAELEQARFTARRNRLLGKTYNKSPGLAAIEALKAVPQGSTVILSTGGKTPPILAGAGGGAGSPGATGSTGSANGEGSAKAGDSDDADGG